MILKIIKKLIYGIIIIIGLQGCMSIDDSKPTELLNQYIKYGFEKSYKKRYNLISTDSKNLCSLGEYIKYYDKPDSLNPKNNEILLIKELEEDRDYPSYKRFKTKIRYITSKNDTIINIFYWTLINENNHWRVVWNSTITQQALQKYNQSDYDGTIKLSEKAIELNPFSADAYARIGWCYYRGISKSYSVTKEQMLKNFKYAVYLEPDIPAHYNSLASYYSVFGIPDLEIENYKKAIELTLNKKESSYLYANMSDTYLGKNNYNEALKAIRKAVSLDSLDTYNWYQYGQLLKRQGKNIEAKEKFEKAITLPSMENALQSGLLYAYAETCYRLKDFTTSKKYILMALELDPSKSKFINLYERVK